MRSLDVLGQVEPGRGLDRGPRPTDEIASALNRPISCTLQTNDGHYVGGGRTTDVLHTDATRVGAWEKFRVSCTNS
jgi:hypothetical protein